MPQHLSALGRFLIIAFFLFHSMAVAVYAIPHDMGVEVVDGTRQVFVPLFRPYMLTTSQWQHWNLFAPNPRRRVSVFAIQQHADDAWEDIFTMTPWNEPFLRRTQWVKLANATDRIGKRLLELTCDQFDLPPGTEVSLLEKWYVIPRDGNADWTPQWEQNRMFTISCHILEQE